jgi:hypothetical protein
MRREGPSGSSSFRLRGARRRPADERTERRLERLVGAGKPHGSRGSPADPPVPDRTDPETPPRCLLPRGGGGREKRARAIAATPVAAAVQDGELRRGTPRGQGQDVGRRLDQVTRALSDPASRCFSPPVPQSWGSGNPEAMDREATSPRQRGMRHGSVAAAASDRRQNPMDGSGPRGREASGEQTVAEVRNLVDGTCRGRQPRVKRTREPVSSKGRENPRRGRSRR